MHGARQTDRYILRGDPAGEEWEPRFTLHGSRFVEVTGYPGTPALDAIDGRVVRTSARATGRFTCSDELLNRLHAMCWWTFASSMQGHPQDSADRSERVGWLGDPIPEDYLYNFDCASFWAKWADDIADSQKENGHVPKISPVHWRRTHDAYAYPAPFWSSTYAVLVWTLYWFLDDEALLARHYDRAGAAGRLPGRPGAGARDRDGAGRPHGAAAGRQHLLGAPGTPQRRSPRPRSTTGTCARWRGSPRSWVEARTPSATGSWPSGSARRSTAASWIPGAARTPPAARPPTRRRCR